MADNIFEQAIEAILKGDADKATEIAKRGIDEGMDPLEIMDLGFIPGINQVGDLFESGRLFLPALIYSAKAMEKATEILNAAIPEGQEPVYGKVIVATVEGDVHDIGKTIVVSLFKANGFEVMDLGRDVAIDKIIDEAEKFGADIIGTSTLLTTTMVAQEELEQELKKADLRGKYKTVVGGAPVTKRWADRIGADAYAQDASDGVKKVKELLS
ncbi:MAG: corrinoid protein [Deltaproteobacteria bacterium]|jgi:trimethylamine corrinoid protein|nr:corrinoid protein [Deltaproteobacteria bacterium]